MSTATTTSHDTGQHTTSRSTSQPNNSPVTQTTPNAAQRLRTTMAAVRLAFTRPQTSRLPCRGCRQVRGVFLLAHGHAAIP
jgi:hypothetical protein